MKTWSNVKKIVSFITFFTFIFSNAAFALDRPSASNLRPTNAGQSPDVKRNIGDALDDEVDSQLQKYIADDKVVELVKEGYKYVAYRVKPVKNYADIPYKKRKAGLVKKLGVFNQERGEKLYEITNPAIVQRLDKIGRRTAYVEGVDRILEGKKSLVHTGTRDWFGEYTLTQLMLTANDDLLERIAKHEQKHEVPGYRHEDDSEYQQLLDDIELFAGGSGHLKQHMQDAQTLFTKLSLPGWARRYSMIVSILCRDVALSKSPKPVSQYIGLPDTDQKRVVSTLSRLVPDLSDLTNIDRVRKILNEVISVEFHPEEGHVHYEGAHDMYSSNDYWVDKPSEVIIKCDFNKLERIVDEELAKRGASTGNPTPTLPTPTPATPPAVPEVPPAPTPPVANKPVAAGTSQVAPAPVALSTDEAETVMAGLPGVYDQYAPGYAQKWGTTVQEEVIIHRDTFLGLLPKEGAVLDAGTGPGRDTAWFIAYGRKAIGVDSSQGQLTEARNLYSDVPVAAMDLRKLAVKPGTLAGVWDNATFHHILSEPAQQEVLKQYYNALADGGCLFLRVKRGDGIGTDEHGRTFKYYQQSELEDLVKSAGFNVLESNVQPDSMKPGQEWVYLFARRRVEQPAVAPTPAAAQGGTQSAPTPPAATEEGAAAIPPAPAVAAPVLIPEAARFLNAVSDWLGEPTTEVNTDVTYVVNLPEDYSEKEALLTGLRQKLGKNASIEVLIRTNDSEIVSSYQKVSDILGLNLTIGGIGVVNEGVVSAVVTQIRPGEGQRYLFVSEQDDPSVDGKILNPDNLDPNLRVALVKKLQSDHAQPTNASVQIINGYLDNKKVIVVTPEPIELQDIRDELQTALAALRKV